MYSVTSRIFIYSNNSTMCYDASNWIHIRVYLEGYFTFWASSYYTFYNIFRMLRSVAAFDALKSRRILNCHEYHIISILWLTGILRNLSSSFCSRTSPAGKNQNKEFQTTEKKLKHNMNIWRHNKHATHHWCAYQVPAAWKEQPMVWIENVMLLKQTLDRDMACVYL